MCTLAVYASVKIEDVECIEYRGSRGCSCNSYSSPVWKQSLSTLIKEQFVDSRNLSVSFCGAGVYIPPPTLSHSLSNLWPLTLSVAKADIFPSAPSTHRWLRQRWHCLYLSQHGYVSVCVCLMLHSPSHTDNDLFTYRHLHTAVQTREHILPIYLVEYFIV